VRRLLALPLAAAAVALTVLVGATAYGDGK
jgi:hypothetical protein